MNGVYYLCGAAGSRIDVELEGRLGAVGSQGSVWKVEGQPGVAVKLVHRPRSGDLADRLKLMSAGPQGWCIRGGEVAVTWPLGCVRRRDDDTLAGYYMPRLSARRFACVDRLFDTGQRARLLPGHTWEWLLRLAGNLAELVGRVHAHGYVIGDLAPQNVYFTPAASACLIDVDGWQLGTGLWCSFSRRDYTAPEVPSGEPVPRNASSDWWSLAVVIAQMLFLGFHPFGGVPAQGSRVLDEVDNMSRRRIYVCGGDVRVPQGTPPVWLLSPRLRTMFRRAFAEGYDDPADRPDPGQWAAELAQARRELVACPAQPSHVYHHQVGTCPWCGIARVRGLDPFPS